VIRTGSLVFAIVAALCAMVFAQPRMRALLGLKAAPVRDRDVDRGVWKVGDPELFRYLFPGAAR
jgi:hypothetical protein